jgi:hypothetical protein
MLHIESSISTSVRLGSNHKPTKPRNKKLFCLSHFETIPQTNNTALLSMLLIESSIPTSVRLGANHKPTKPKSLKLFCLCLIFGPYHKPHITAHLSMKHIELYFFLCLIGIKPQAHTTKGLKSFSFIRPKPNIRYPTPKPKVKIVPF